MSDPLIPVSMRRSLEGLPEFEPDPGLWARIERSVDMRARRRRLTGLVGGSLAASLALISALVFTHSPADPAGARFSALVARSQSLELQLFELRDEQADLPVWMDEIGRSERVALVLLDERIAAAGDQERLPALWEQRNALLERLVIAYREPVLVTQL